MKENTDSKNTTEQLQTISGLLNISLSYNINSYKKEYLSYTQHPNAKVMYLFSLSHQPAARNLPNVAEGQHKECE